MLQKSSGVEKFHAQDRGHHGFVENFLSHRTENLRKGSLLCFGNFLVQKKFMGKSGGGCYHYSPLKFFCLTVPKNFVGEPILVSEKFWSRNLLIKFKNVCEGWDSSPYLPLLNHVVIPTVTWEQLQLPTNVSEIVKISDSAEI